MQAAYERSRRRQAALGIGIVTVVLIGAIIAIYAATNSKDKGSASGTTTTSTTTPPVPLVSLPAVAPGASIAGAPPCPAADGSSPRTTQFDQPPPMCIDPKGEYEAIIETSAAEGPLRVDIMTEAYPQAANVFVFLARYHYYDGLPITKIVPAAYAEVGNPTNADGKPGPGFSIPNEAASRGPALSALMVAMVPNQDGTIGGSFLMGLAGQFAQIPQNAPQVGQILDDRQDPNQKEPEPHIRGLINKAATKSGSPSQVITINKITVNAR